MVHIRAVIQTVCNYLKDIDTGYRKVDCTSHRLAAEPHHGLIITLCIIHSMNINRNHIGAASNVNSHTELTGLSHQATSLPGAPV